MLSPGWRTCLSWLEDTFVLARRHWNLCRLARDALDGAYRECFEKHLERKVVKSKKRIKGSCL